MSTFTLKSYQRSALESVTLNFRDCLQTAEGRFYPDFVCKLADGRVLAVEYKGADRWKAAEGDRLVGSLWEETSNGQCLFVMVKEKEWGWIEEKISGTLVQCKR